VINVHPTTARAGYLATEEQTSYQTFERNSMFVIPYLSTIDELAATQDHQRLCVCHYFLFPNTIVNCRPGAVQVFSFMPESRRSTRFVCWNLVHPECGIDPAAQDAAWAYFRQIVEEDVLVDIEVDATADSMAFARLAGLANRRECRVAHMFANVNALEAGAT
jgi:phenylpropionate dioxygenase-like ring-hydroxylating dioxygenase large terminal subunit